MLETRIEPIGIPEQVRDSLGSPDSGTRMYRYSGSQEEFETWFDAVCEACGPDGVLSPGAAGAYARVSRTGVHKRMKEGGLTAFLFHLAQGPDSGGNGARAGEGGRPYTFIPVRECRAWAKILKRRRGGKKGERDHEIADRPKAPPDRDSWRQW